MTEAPNVIPAQVYEIVDESDILDHGSHYFLQLPASGDQIRVYAMDGTLVYLEASFVQHDGSPNLTDFFPSAIIYARRRTSPDFSQRVDFRVAEREGTGEHMKKAAVVG